MGKQNAAIKIVCENRKARHDFFIHETFETGLELKGTEVKSLRAGRANLKDSYAFIKNGEVFVEHMHISPYEQGNIFNKDPLRVRKLLMHKSEIDKLSGATSEKTMTIMPLQVYFKNGRAKLEIGLAKGKKNYDKRETIAKHDAQRDIERAMKMNNR